MDLDFGFVDESCLSTDVSGEIVHFQVWSCFIFYVFRAQENHKKLLYVDKLVAMIVGFDDVQPLKRHLHNNGSDLFEEKDRRVTDLLAQAVHVPINYVFSILSSFRVIYLGLVLVCAIKSSHAI